MAPASSSSPPTDTPPIGTKYGFEPFDQAAWLKQQSKGTTIEHHRVVRFIRPRCRRDGRRRVVHGGSLARVVTRRLVAVRELLRPDNPTVQWRNASGEPFEQVGGVVNRPRVRGGRLRDHHQRHRTGHRGSAPGHDAADGLLDGHNGEGRTTTATRASTRAAARRAPRRRRTSSVAVSQHVRDRRRTNAIGLPSFTAVSTAPSTSSMPRNVVIDRARVIGAIEEFLVEQRQYLCRLQFRQLLQRALVAGPQHEPTIIQRAHRPRSHPCRSRVRHDAPPTRAGRRDPASRTAASRPAVPRAWRRTHADRGARTRA